MDAAEARSIAPDAYDDLPETVVLLRQMAAQLGAVAAVVDRVDRLLREVESMPQWKRRAAAKRLGADPAAQTISIFREGYGG